MRLQDGNAANEGRLEICADDPNDSEGPVWGTICDDYWTTDDAHVACRQLDYTHAQSGARDLLRSHFGAGDGPILLDDMRCTSTESSLLDCEVAGGETARDVIGVHNCSKRETVGIRCLDATTDATLERLTVRDANGVVPLSPSFSSSRERYSATVPNEITSVMIFATPSQDDASVEYLDSSNTSLGTGGSVVISNLVAGATEVRVKITAPDDTTEKTYTVTINREAQPNRPATGQPSISGTLRVGQTLTASPGTIADLDGLTSASYSYQWIRIDSSNSESPISNADGTTYELTSNDQGNRLKVEASFTDDRNNDEMRTSAATGTVQAEVVNPPPPPPPPDPAVTLVLSPGSISENGGVSTVSATVSPTSPEAFTVTVSAQALSPAVGGDFNLQGATLSFAANATRSTGSVTITAVDNDDDAADKRVTVSGTVSLSSVDAPGDQTLRITDDDEPTSVDPPDNPPVSQQPNGNNPDTNDPPGNQQPTDDNDDRDTNEPTDDQPSVSQPPEQPATQLPEVALVLSPGSISENGGVSTITATTSTAASEAFTVTVSATAVSPAVAGDFTLSGTTLSFAANATLSTGVVTITAADNQVDAPDKRVTVSGTVSLADADVPAHVTLTITDDESAPVVTLVLTPDSIAENGGRSTVTATVSPASSQAFSVTVSVRAVSPAVAGDFRLEGNTLSFAADANASTGTVTITAVDNEVDAPGKMVSVSGTVSLSRVEAPQDAVLTIVDDEDTPVITLVLNPGSISESGGVSTITATASPASWRAFTVTVSASAVAPAVAGDFMRQGATLSFAAGATTTTGTVTITSVGNDTDAPDKSVTVSGRVSLSGSAAPDGVTLIITDDDEPVPDLSVADASGRESDGRLVFEVSLSIPPSQAVTMNYTTADATAKAGADYVADAGTLTMNAGVTRATVEVSLLADVLNEEDESFTLTLSSVAGANLVDGQAIGLIAGGDSEATAQWLARFGRTTVDHVLDALEDQMWAQRGGAGEELTVAGHNLLNQGVSAPGGPAAPGGLSLALPLGTGGPGLSPFGLQTQSLGVSGANSGPARFDDRSAWDMLAGSSLRLNAANLPWGEFSFWARGAYSRFDGADKDLAMRGEVRSAAVGVDYSCGRCLYGVALSHSTAEGDLGFDGSTLAYVESTLTGLYPYMRYHVTDRLSIWGVAGYAAGDMTSLPAFGGEFEEVDLTSRMAAVGARSELLTLPGGLTLALKGDAMLVRTESDGELGLIETEGEARRIRVGLEGSHVATLDNNSSLRSFLDLSVRTDSGDADDGFGFELGGGLDWYGLVPGLSVNVGARGLIAHGADEFEEWGYSGGLRYDPTPSSAEGLLIGLTQSWGAPLNAGLRNALWNDAPAIDRTVADIRRQQNLEAELAYGFETPAGLGVPWARAGLAGLGNEYRVGYSLLTRFGVPSLEMGDSIYGRDYRVGWELNLHCRAHLTVELVHSRSIAEAGSDTGVMLRFRSLMRPPGRSHCNPGHQPNYLMP